jgi:hypothetical protein
MGKLSVPERERSRGRVEVWKTVWEVMVVPLRTAELVESIEVVKRVCLSSWKVIVSTEIEILKCLWRVRYRQARRLLRRSGTCSTRESSTDLAVFPLKIGSNTT